MFTLLSCQRNLHKFTQEWRSTISVYQHVCSRKLHYSDNTTSICIKKTNINFINSRTFKLASCAFKGRIYWKRCFPDHRGRVTPTNRPDSDFISEEESESILDDADYSKLVQNATGFSAGVVSNVTLEGDVYVILPWVKWGPMKKSITSDKLLLDEACALVNTLKNVNVVGKDIVKIKSQSSQHLFGPGQVEKLAVKVKSLQNLSTVFVSVDFLRIDQLRHLEEMFGCRVIDRYWLVLSIFHQHAKTAEAKLQVALAELPYIKSRVSHESEKTFVDDKIRRLQTQLKKLARHRENVRRNRERQSLPSIAVVGYTNAGKTTLISSLSGDCNLEGKDQLFATLDVTAHAARLPWGVKVLMLDTVGFIQDLPTTLVASFNATLQDAANADVVIHIRDLSHPDRLMQHATVMSALYSINLSPNTPIITLDNKVDLLENFKRLSGDSSLTENTGNSVESGEKDGTKPTPLDKDAGVTFLSDDKLVREFYCREGHFAAVAKLVADDDLHSSEGERLRIIREDFMKVPSIAVSAKNNDGLLTAAHAVEQQILRVTDKKVYRFTLPTGGDHVRILRNIADVSEEKFDENTNNTKVIAIMDPQQFSAFKKYCRKNAQINR